LFTFRLYWRAHKTPRSYLTSGCGSYRKRSIRSGCYSTEGGMVLRVTMRCNRSVSAS
jgi:hypothetical protein